MAIRKVLVLVLVLTALIIPLIQLAIGFYYVDTSGVCPLQNDLPLIMSIGGVFQTIFFAAAFALVFSITPKAYRLSKKPDAEANGKSGNRSTQLLIAAVTLILGSCSIIFFILLHMRIFTNYSRVQTSNKQLATYCLSTVFYSAFALLIATYVGYLLFVAVAIIMLFGIAIPKA